MLTLNDGRSELWQWDTGRTLAVDADCSQVHFSNKVFGRSIDVDVVDGVAEIPDILLQADKDLIAWAFVGAPENGYTKISKVFKVNRRNKPANYVFTPPEQTTLGEILERLDDIESAQDPDAIKNAVEDYLDNNPIHVEETDPTVPDWAKQPTKPTYTAEEVGALPADTKIPTTASDVGAISVPKTAEVGQTIVVKEIDKNGVPTAWEAVDLAGVSYPVIKMTDAYAELLPNTYYIWQEVTALSITLGAEIDGITNEYCFEFTSGEIATELTVPSSVRWVQTPSIETGKTYQVSILNGIGAIAGA